MSYVVNNHLNNLYVLSNKAIGPGKNPKLIIVGPTSIPEARGTKCPLLHENKKKERDRKNLFTTTSGGSVIIVRNNSFIDSK